MLEMMLFKGSSAKPFPPGLVKSPTLLPDGFNYSPKGTYDAGSRLCVFDSANSNSASDFYAGYVISNTQNDISFTPWKLLSRSILDAAITIKDRFPTVVGGQISITAQNTVYRWTPASNTWASLASLPSDGAKAQAQSNNLGVLFCADGNTQGRIFKMNHAANAWVQFSSLHNTGLSMNRPSLGAWADKYCLIGGLRNNRGFIYDYNEAVPPVEISPLPIAGLFRGSNVAYYKNKLYLLGGTDGESESSGIYSSTMWVYSLDTAQWSSFDLPTRGLFKPSLIPIMDRLFILGGRTSSTSANTYPDTVNREIYIYTA